MPSLESYKAAFMLLFLEDDKGTPLDAPVHSEIEEQLEERLERVIEEQAPWTQQLEELFGRLIEKSVKNSVDNSIVAEQMPGCIAYLENFASRLAGWKGVKQSKGEGEGKGKGDKVKHEGKGKANGVFSTDLVTPRLENSASRMKALADGMRETRARAEGRLKRVIEEEQSPWDQQIGEQISELIEDGIEQMIEDSVRAEDEGKGEGALSTCLLYTSPSPRDVEESRMPSSA